jgi:hypothetical protein
MAQKLQLLKLLQEIRGFADVGNRNPDLRPLLHASNDLRAMGQPTSLPVRRFSIPVRHEHHPESPAVVPITPGRHLAESSQRITKISLRTV